MSWVIITSLVSFKFSLQKKLFTSVSFFGFFCVCVMSCLLSFCFIWRFAPLPMYLLWFSAALHLSMVRLPRPPRSQTPPAIGQLALGELLSLCLCQVLHCSLFPAQICMGTPHPHLIPQNPQTRASVYCFPAGSSGSCLAEFSKLLKCKCQSCRKADGGYAYLNSSFTRPHVVLFN